MLGWERTFAPGLGRGAADQRRLALGGGPAVTRTSAAWRGRGASGGGRWPDPFRAIRERFEGVGAAGLSRVEGLSPFSDPFVRLKTIGVNRQRCREATKLSAVVWLMGSRHG